MNQTTTDTVGICTVHNKKQKNICLQCNQLACAVCAVLQHKQHEMDHVDNIKAMIQQHKYGDTFNARLETLLGRFKVMSTSYQILDQSKCDLSEHFRQLHEWLIVEEHRLKAPIVEQLDKVTNSISCITGEIESINSIFNDSVPLSARDDIDTLIKEVATTQPTVEQFMNKTFPPRQDDGFESMQISDTQLLTMVQQRIQHIKSPAQSEDYKYTTQLKIHTERLIDVRKQIGRCFENIDLETRAKAEKLHNHMLVVDREGWSLYSLDTRQWVNHPRENEKTNVDKAVVYAQGHVYCFGCMGSSTYDKFSVADHQWRYDIPIDTIQGGYDISVCYDGNRFIYLVGGTEQDGHTLNRVDRFNIETQEFSHVGELPQDVDKATTFVKDGELYVACQFREIMVMNLKTLQTRYLRLDLSLYIERMFCFDSKDTLYCLDAHGFFAVTLSTEKIVVLGAAHQFEYYSHLHWTPEHGIFITNGKGNKHVSYSVENDQWEDTQIDAELFNTCYGICLIRIE
ncbi:hypothetical protein SAMD00019534_028960, partial [Acytostelium subglobosum LB1]|uniref:hypothetical protein n=1 Tax=Acytostelium subglobosum LB1 TaxID=1410327 RepID=UPI000644E20B